MISIEEALQIVRENLPSRRTESLSLANARGRILAEEIFAREASPRFTNSAMDGFAVRWEDVQSAFADKPVQLQIVGESQAGIPFSGELHPGQAIRISTGAMLCAGADTIVPVEDADMTEQTVIVRRVEKMHQHLRFQGEEFAAGAPLLPKGTPLSPAHIALLASQGIATVSVYASPVVSVIVTGTELMPYDAAEIAPWQIRESNGIMLRTAVAASGGRITVVEQVGDDYQQTINAVRNALEQSDVVIFSGGVSVGPHDLVKKAARECGFETLFWKVKQKPGKPLFFARHQETLFFGLPGNPVSAYMCYLYYIHPLLSYLLGGEFTHRSISGEVGESIVNKIARTHLIRVRLTNREGQPPRVEALPKQGSHMLTTLTQADGFIVVEPQAVLKKGDVVQVYPFS